jgi:hypothetical protein
LCFQCSHSLAALSLRRARSALIAAAAVPKGGSGLWGPKAPKKLVLSDPDSLSGKARKAAKYGVRRIAERAFWCAIGVSID